MQDEKNELPEGTDKVIVGASATTTGGADEIPTNEETDVMVIEIDDRGPPAGATTGLSPGGLSADTGASADTPTTSGTSGTSSTKGAVINKIRSGGEKLSGQAADKARGLVGQGLERGAEALANVGRMVGDTADGIDERLGAEYGDYARRAATAIEDAANNLASKDADELIDDTRTFVRKSPGVALAGAAVVGFALARLIKAGLDRDTQDGGSTGGRSGGSREA
jgi:ElaB/YqjD/DUF883 family membrane-anchored ribosome-binding protein